MKETKTNGGWFFHPIKTHKNHKRAALDLIVERQKISAEKIMRGRRGDLFEITKAMLDRPCATNNMQKCSEECAHFKAGSAHMGRNINPKCKLWVA